MHQTAKIFATGRSQAVRLPLEFRFDVAEVFIHRDPATGDVTLEEWPQIQQGINNQVATQSTTVMILNAKGRSRTVGSSRTMIVDQGQGDKPVTP